MANLWTGDVKFEGYKTLEDITGISEEVNTTYVIQIIGKVVLREGTTGKGFVYASDKPFQYTANGDELYIAIEGLNHSIRLNLAS